MDCDTSFDTWLPKHNIWSIYHIQKTQLQNHHDDRALHTTYTTLTCQKEVENDKRCYKFELGGKGFAFEELYANVKPNMLPYLIVIPWYRVRWSGLKFHVEWFICWSIYRLATRRCCTLKTKDWKGMPYTSRTEDKNMLNCIMMKYCVQLKLCKTTAFVNWLWSVLTGSDTLLFKTGRK